VPEKLGACAARRLRKEQRREERQTQVKEQRRAKRTRQKQRRQEARRELLDSMMADERDVFLEAEREAGRKRKEELQVSLQRAFDTGRPRVVINCSFSAAMNHKELTSLAKQAQLTYTALRDLRSSIQLHLASIHKENEAVRALDGIGFRSWLLHIHEQPVWEVFPMEQLVILSPDAEEDLEDVEDDRIYVVGGLVDRSVAKLESASQARAHGLGCLRRLPIKKHGPPGAHPVLNIDVVVRILAERVRRRSQPDGSDSWKSILAECLPQRHSGQPTARMRRKQRCHDRQIAAKGSADTALGETHADGESVASDDSSTSCGAAVPEG